MDPEKRIRISVVIITYNSANSLEPLLISLRRQTLLPDEIIVVDGGSRDETVKIAKKFDCKIHIEPVKIRAKARNLGVQVASGEILAFIDSDCIPERDWLENLVRNFHRGENIAGVSGKVLALNKEKLIPRLLDLLSSGKPHYATWNIAYKKKVLEEVNGFDDRLHACEDQALAWKILRKGYKILWAPNAIVYHRHRESLVSFLKQQYEYGKWAVITRRLYGISYYKSLLLLFTLPLLFLFKYLRKISLHPLLPFLLTLSAASYSLGSWRGFLCKLES
ncbi:MAG: hypothetical protein DRJ30_06230 [Candidatus Methanomethylicota archaeon]|nr:MAG: hypothetical protein DRJ30_06230 [Candidatus Verstraetearchaeota archaeon]